MDIALFCLDVLGSEAKDAYMTDIGVRAGGTRRGGSIPSRIFFFMQNAYDSGKSTWRKQTKIPLS